MSDHESRRIAGLSGKGRRVLAVLASALMAGPLLPGAAHAAANFYVTLKANPPAVVVGQNLVFTITVTNNGPEVGYSADLRVFLPRELAFIGITASVPLGGTSPWGCQTPGFNDTGNVECEGLVAFPVGSSVEFTLTTRAHPPVSGTPTTLATIAEGPNVRAQYAVFTPVGYPPTVSSITPNAGPTYGTSRGGITFATIKGTGFTLATDVTVGGVPVAAWSVVNDTTISGVPQAHPAGPASVQVTTPFGSTDPNSLYVYQDQFDPPLVSSVAPAALPTTLAKVPIVIQGSGFTGAIGVVFGGVGASYQILTPNLILAELPAHSPGTVDVSVTGPAGVSTLANSFTYIYIAAP
ncbi:MAG: IPT/TIG domain-containing protein [Alphaproteobacteria bacterium]|nr:IPT/TIG domain-containing protein [Alphaproteobacteria bacterium]